MSGIVFGAYSASTSTGSTGFTPGVNYKPIIGEFVAAGAFTGDAGLPTSIDSLADYHSYIDALLAKTSEVSTDDTQLRFINMTHQYFGIGGSGNDKLIADSNATATGTLMGGAGDDTVNGGSGDDVLSGGDGNDYILGGDGNDTMDAGLGAGSTVVMYGGTGENTVSFAKLSGGVTFDLTLNTQTVHGASLTVGGVQDLVGTANADMLTGDANDNVIEGNGGDDTVVGGDGVDTLSYAHAGNGVLVFMVNLTASYDTGVGYQTASGFENLFGSIYDDTLAGTAGDNVIEGNGGNDYMDGFGGVDTLSYAHAANGVHVEFSIQGGPQDTGVGMQTLFAFTNLIGSDFADALSGDRHDNSISGGAGADTIDGYGGADTLAGGGGENTVSYQSADRQSHGVTVSLALQGVAQDTGVGIQTLSGFTNLSGSFYADKLVGDAGANVISSGGGSYNIKDQIYGGGGDDHLIARTNGGAIYGQAGNDLITTGGAGAYLDGGAGADVYDFQDLIGAPYRAATLGEIGATDTVALGAAAAAHGFSSFTAVDKFTDTAGEVVSLYHAGADRTVYKFDLDGDGRTDVRLIAKGGDYGYDQFTGVDTSHLSGANAHDVGALVI